ncbi:MAG: ATP-grasp domain-containing protein [Actinobacteria bacterium]|nr:ATP-grasp domain-containing protein [Actinomycetota bacterium]
MNVLFSSCGRRVELIRCFRDAVKRLGGGMLIGVDTNPLAPALQEVDEKIIVPSCESNGFIPEIIKICSEREVDVIVPLIDPELSVYAANMAEFEKIGTTVAASDARAADICGDKVLTAAFLEESGLPYLKTAILGVDKWADIVQLPAVLKPRSGSGGKDVYIVNSGEEVEVLFKRVEKPILQELARGQEITLDCMVDFSHQPLRIVARERLEIRAGESSKGRTVKDAEVTRLTSALLRKLNARGPVTVQCFRYENQYVFTEINPRFGGGYPLAHAAGADFPYILLSMCSGKTIGEDMNAYEENVYFCRFDDAFYLKPDDRDDGFKPKS